MFSSSRKREEFRTKVYLKWANSHLCQRDITASNLETDFHDGTKWCFLYEILQVILSGKSLIGIHMSPTQEHQKMANIKLFVNRLNYIVKEHGIRLAYSSKTIRANNVRGTLGIMWILIVKFVCPKREESLSRKRMLLRWCQRVTLKYENVCIKNFTRSWKDGVAFNALLHQFNKSWFDIEKERWEKDIRTNLEHAFSLAEEKLGVQRLLEIEDFEDLEIPDERSVMLYVSVLYHRFKEELEKVSKVTEDLVMRLEYVQSEFIEESEKWKSFVLSLFIGTNETLKVLKIHFL